MLNSSFRPLFASLILVVLLAGGKGQASQEAIIDSMDSVQFTYTHIVDGDVSKPQVDNNVLTASSEFKSLFETLFTQFKHVTHTNNLTIKICSDLRACFSSQYQPSRNTLFIKIIEDVKKPSELTAGKAVAVHEYIHRVFHSLMSKSIEGFSDQLLAFEKGTLSRYEKEKFLNFLNFSYMPTTELIADFSSAVILNDPNIMALPYGKFRGFEFEFSESEEHFYNAVTFGNSSALVPNPYLMLVPVRNNFWKHWMKLNTLQDIEARNSNLQSVIAQMILLNQKLYSKAFHSGITKEDLIKEIRNLVYY